VLLPVFVNYDVFISYADKDFNKAKEIHDHLLNYGVRVFLAKLSIESGNKWKEELKSNINSSDLFLFLISSNSLKSFYAVSEAGYAWLSDKDIIPIKIERKQFKKEELKWLSDYQMPNSISKFYGDFKKRITWVYIKKVIFWLIIIGIILYLKFKKV
jgi:hypothetical protein